VSQIAPTVYSVTDLISERDKLALVQAFRELMHAYHQCIRRNTNIRCVLAQGLIYAFKQLVAEERLKPTELHGVIENYLYTEQEPLGDDCEYVRRKAKDPGKKSYD